MSSAESPRRYRKTRRAEHERKTRQRITEAAVELHGTVGPANTTLSDVAKLSGVSRTTLYKHFPSEVELFEACTSHWAAENPFPDPAAWSRFDDPSERLVRALRELYRWYRLKRAMLGKVFRDLPAVPALQTVMAGVWSRYVDEMIRTLGRDLSKGGASRKSLDAALRLAVDFNTWSSLDESGLSPDGAAKLVARMVEGACRR